MNKLSLYSRRCIACMKRHPFGLILGTGVVAAIPTVLYRMQSSEVQSAPKRLSTVGNSVGYEGPDELHPDRLKPPIQNYADYLIIGGGASAATAAKVIRAQDPNSSVLLVTDENELPYNRNALRRELWSCTDEQRERMAFTRWDDKETSLYVLDEDAYTTEGPTNQAVTILKSTKVKELDVKNQAAILDNDWAIKYDKCLLATGTKVNSPSWCEEACRQPEIKEKIVKLEKVEDFRRLRSLLMQNAKSVVIVGSGPESCELAYTLTTTPDIKARVTLLCTHPKGILGHILPQWFSNECTQSLEAVGVQVITGAKITRLKKRLDRLVINYRNAPMDFLWGGSKSEADLIILPDRDVVNDSVELNGAIETDPTKRMLATCDLRIAPNVWCAGSACKFYDVTTRRRFGWRHYEGSVMTGRVAGANMSGDLKPVYRQPMFWVDIGHDVTVEGVGLIDSNLDVDSVMLTGREDKAESKIQPDPYQAVLFYKSDGYIVGVLTWNILGKLRVLREILSEHLRNPDLSKLVWRIMQEKGDDVNEEESQDASGVFAEKK